MKKFIVLVFGTYVLLFGTGCDNTVPSKITVEGETRHRFLVGVDLDSFTNLFEESCRQECVETSGSMVPSPVLNACTDSCIARRAEDILKAIDEVGGQE